MAVLITDNRTILDEADAVTNFNQGTANTTDYAESTGSISLAVNIATDQLFWTGTGIDLTVAGDEMLYVWSSCTATQNSWKEATIANSSHGLWLSDGTNEIVLLEAGNDRDVFKHADTQVQFQSFVIDIDYLGTKNTAGEIIEVSGTYASFDPTSISEIGAYYVTTSKALGGGYNCFLDAIRYGTAGITVYGGSTSDRGNFLEIVERDRSKSDTGSAANEFYAGGLIREYTKGTYGVQGTLQFGHGSETADSWFEDSGVSITFEDRDVGDDKYEFIVDGHLNDSNNFFLYNSTIATAGPALHLFCENTNIDNLVFDTVVFNGITAGIEFPNVSAGLNHVVTNCTFNGCSFVEPGTVDFTHNTLANWTGTYGAVLGTYGSSTWDGNTFISPGSGHAIFIFQAGTYDFTNLSFVGFADQGGTDTDRSIYNVSAGETIINNYGSTGISVRHVGGGTTTVLNPVTTSVYVATVAGVPIENARVFLQATDGTGPLPFEDTVTITSSSTTASVSHTAHGLVNGQKIVIRGANEEEYNGVYAISNSATNSYDYTFAGSGTSPATGAIKATGVLIHELTPSSGIVTDSRSLGASDQPVTGHARKSSSTPFYKSSAIVGTVDAEDGAAFTAVMILDE